MLALVFWEVKAEKAHDALMQAAEAPTASPAIVGLYRPGMVISSYAILGAVVGPMTSAWTMAEYWIRLLLALISFCLEHMRLRFPGDARRCVEEQVQACDRFISPPIAAAPRCRAPGGCCRDKNPRFQDSVKDC